MVFILRVLLAKIPTLNSETVAVQRTHCGNEVSARPLATKNAQEMKHVAITDLALTHKMAPPTAKHERTIWIPSRPRRKTRTRQDHRRDN